MKKISNSASASFKKQRLKKRLNTLLFVSVLLFGLFFVSNFAKAAATHYIREGALGSGDGSDWTNAFTNIPATFVRGDIYYVADGVYAGNHSLATAESGADYVNIKKATASVHGTDTGWSASDGNGTATFTGYISIATGYWDFDGVTGGGPANWTSGYGFAFTSTAGTNVEYFKIAGGVSNIHLHHVHFNQIGNTEIYTTGASAIYDGADLNNSLFEYLYFDNLGGLPFFLRDGTGNIIQYNYFGNICGMSVADINQHCEGLVIHDMDNLQFRWNYIFESPSSGGFVKNNVQTSDSIRIYGNVFANGFPIQCNSGSCTNWRIFNNTFYQATGGPFGGDGAYSGLLFYNNLTYSIAGPDSLRAEHDYNWFSKVSSGRCQSNAAVNENITVRFPADCDLFSETANPFVNSSGNIPESFKLAAAISGWPGTNVCLLDNCSGENRYNKDLFGNTRGSDGVWDRGAYEFGAIVPPTVYTLAYTAGPNGSISGNLSQALNSSSAGTAVTAVPNVGYHFVNWSDASAANPRIDSNVGGNISVTASFAADPAPIVDTTPPGSVTNFLASGLADQITLTWTNPGDSDFAGVKIYHKPGSPLTDYLDVLATVIFEGNAQKFVDTNLVNGQNYYYSIYSYDSGWRYSAAMTASAMTESEVVPPVVQNPIAGDNTGNGVATPAPVAAIPLVSPPIVNVPVVIPIVNLPVAIPIVKIPVVIPIVKTPVVIPIVQLANPLGAVNSIPALIGVIISAALGLVGSLALVMFIYGGFTWILAAGNVQAIAKGKNILIWATVGLVVIFASYSLVSFVIGAIVTGTPKP